MRLVGHGGFGPCLVRALATYVALRDRGWPVEFVSGVRRRGKDPVGHAWVELDGAVLLELDNPNECARFEENFRYPPRARVASALRLSQEDPEVVRAVLRVSHDHVDDAVPSQVANRDERRTHEARRETVGHGECAVPDAGKNKDDA